MERQDQCLAGGFRARDLAGGHGDVDPSLPQPLEDRLWLHEEAREPVVQVELAGPGPVPVRERMIPKPGGKLRRLGIATITDRVVQASLKLVLEPIFEADFRPCSYGFVCPEQEGSLM